MSTPSFVNWLRNEFEVNSTIDPDGDVAKLAAAVRFDSLWPNTTELDEIAVYLNDFLGTQQKSIVLSWCEIAIFQWNQTVGEAIAR